MRTRSRGTWWTSETHEGDHVLRPSKRSTDPTTMSEPVRFALAISTARACGGSRSSESTNVR